jgi:NitT/TauT family transport system substrate-binding protein
MNSSELRAKYSPGPSWRKKEARLETGSAPRFSNLYASPREFKMSKLLVQRHARLQDAVAEHLGTFRKHGLDLELVEHRGRGHSGAIPNGYEKLFRDETTEMASAYRDFVLSGATSNVTATSNWAVSAAVASGYGRLWPHAYSIMPAGIYVGPQSRISTVQELVDREIVVGRHSGSHFAALFFLRRLAPETRTRPKFIDGKENRLNHMLGDPTSVGSMYGTDAYVLEAKGYRKLVDTSFIVTFMIAGEPAEESVKKYFAALRDAQLAIDEDPEQYKSFLARDLPKTLRSSIETHSFGIGERMIFEDFTEDMRRRSLQWVLSQKMLPASWLD